MERKLSLVFTERRQSGEFLKSDSREKPVVLKKDVAAHTLGALSGEFPEALFGESFENYALEKLGDCESFAVLGVKPDSVAEHDRPDIAQIVDMIFIETARATDREMRSLGGFWGVLKQGVVEAVLPGKDADQAMACAKRIRDAVRKTGHATASIGVALFPQIDFDKKQVLHNTFAALEHAALLGCDQNVLFDAVTLNVRADALYDHGDLDAAMDQYKKALEIDPHDANVLNSLGVCFAAAGRRDEARECFEKAAQEAPDDVMAFFNLGLCRLMAKEAEKALEYFQKCQSIEKDVCEVLVGMGRAHLALDRPDRAADVLVKAVAKDAASFTALRYLGDARLKLGELAGAAKAYEKAMTIKANDPETLFRLASTYLEQDENREIAQDFLKQATELCPKNAIYRQRLAQAHEKTGDYKGALAEYALATSLGCDCSQHVRRMEKILISGQE